MLSRGISDTVAFVDEFGFRSLRVMNGIAQWFD